MGEFTGIKWTDSTFNPWWGCQRVSAGCEHCYAETFSKRVGLKIWGPGDRRQFGDKHWKEPLRWNAAAKASGKRHLVFCASMADVFEDRRDLDEPRARLWALIRDTPHLTWLLLTKRPEHADKLWEQARFDVFDDSGLHGNEPGPTWQRNVWLGTTAEDQQRADERIPHLLRVPAAVRFLSCEPLLSEVLLHKWFAGTGQWPADAAGGIDWVIGGGESGPGARPCDVAWLRSLRDQCKTAGIPFFAKQLGAKPMVDGSLHRHESASGQRGWLLWADTTEETGIYEPKGGDPSEWPEDLRVREFPAINDVREAAVRPSDLIMNRPSP